MVLMKRQQSVVLNANWMDYSMMIKLVGTNESSKERLMQRW